MCIHYVYVLNTFVRILRTYETRVAQLNAKHTNYSDTMIIRTFDTDKKNKLLNK